MSEDFIIVEKTEVTRHKIPVSEAPDYIDDLEEWAKDIVVTNAFSHEKETVKSGLNTNSGDTSE